MKFLKILAVLLIALLVSAMLLLIRGDIPADVVDGRYTGPTSQFLTLPSGARVHFRDDGNSRGLPVILIHGSGASLHTFEPWVDELGDDYRIVTLDLPGHGLTGAVPDGDYSRDAFLNTVTAVADHLRLDAFVLGGNSMGGGVSWRYALAYPERVTALILIDASGPRSWWDIRDAADDDGDESPIVFRLLAQPWFRAIAGSLDPYYLIKQGVESSYNHSPVVTEDLIQRYYDLALREGSRAATLARFEQRPADEDVDLGDINQPTLVMWGREDALIGVEFADRFAATLPNAEAVIFDDVGHVPMEEIPGRSASAVRAFLEQLTMGATP